MVAFTLVKEHACEVHPKIDVLGTGQVEAW